MTAISAYTYAHNPVELGYPIVEAIHAVIPYVDELVILDMASTPGGASDKLFRELDGGRIRVERTDWQRAKESGGATLDRGKNACHQLCTRDKVWLFEADEVYHEQLA